MDLKLKNSLVFFDLETTGTNITKDRIVELSFIKVTPKKEVDTLTQRINPQMPIPAETSMIHGIYDEDVKDAPTFKEIARNLYKFLEGCDLAGFNIIRFDVPILVEAFLRENLEFDVSRRKLVDAQKIFHLMEKRTLSAAYEFYCHKTLEDAHSAEADTKATLEVLEAQVKRYNQKPVTDAQGNEIGIIRDDVDSLHNISTTKMVDLAGRMCYNEEGIEIINFGKHKNKPVEKVLASEPAFYDWMMKGDFPLDTKRKLTEIKLRSLKSRF
uniref:3'-5' exonuclease n=1 Tax=Roseihalotalea indica TaxID=2867963 RepID=A0AA49Q058_9BACT|nr:3'-5' exonuclease [Tunicatimonas sp. TK19036]